MKYSKIWLTGLVLTGILVLAACKGATPEPVQHVIGLPQGSDDFPWWNDTVFYEIFVRSFYDTTNDGVGDLAGIISKLDYLNDGNPETTSDLEITGLWLMPIHPSPLYHGYAVTDYYAVNPEYGSLEDMQRLVEEAHQRGIRVTIDLVLNHSSDQHAWFGAALGDATSETRDWYIWSDKKPSYKGPWGEEVWHPSPSGYYYGIFEDFMPDLNYTNPEVTQEIRNVARFWLQEVGVDGFRLDAARYMVEEGEQQSSTASTHAFWEDFRQVVKQANPQGFTVGEIWTSNQEVVDYVEGDELDLAFNFDLASVILDAVSRGNGAKLDSALRSSYNLFPPNQFATFLSNHDINRTMSQLFKDVEKAKLAAAVLLTAPGVPYLYYGEEIGMSGYKPEEDIRLPMQWSTEANAGFSQGTPWRAVAEDYPTVNVAVETQDPNSLLSYYRQLIQLRNRHAALRMGEYISVKTNQAGLAAYLRISAQETVLVVMNLKDEPFGQPELSLAKGPLAGTYQAEYLLGEGKLPELNANAAGGFDSYLPMEEIPADSAFVIRLLSE